MLDKALSCGALWDSGSHEVEPHSHRPLILVILPTAESFTLVHVEDTLPRVFVPPLLLQHTHTFCFPKCPFMFFSLCLLWHPAGIVSSPGKKRMQGFMHCKVQSLGLLPTHIIEDLNYLFISVYDATCDHGKESQSITPLGGFWTRRIMTWTQAKLTTLLLTHEFLSLSTFWTGKTSFQCQTYQSSLSVK
jgi:hypothetical protein